MSNEALNGNFAKPMLAPVRVLNLYACLGGNRLLWENCEVTAVEWDEELAKLYQERFPNDKVIVADAHQYLLDHYEEFDEENPYFRNEIIKYEKECLKSGVSINFIYNSLMYKFQKYSDEKNKIKLIERLDFTDKNRVKVLLNKASFSSKKEELELAIKNFTLIKYDLFEWLDKTKNPYFFILQPFYKFGSGINYRPIPYKKDNMSGIQNLHIASDYAEYILFR